MKGWRSQSLFAEDVQHEGTELARKMTELHQGSVFHVALRKMHSDSPVLC